MTFADAAVAPCMQVGAAKLTAKVEYDMHCDHGRSSMSPRKQNASCCSQLAAQKAPLPSPCCATFFACDASVHMYLTGTTAAAVMQQSLLNPSLTVLPKMCSRLPLQHTKAAMPLSSSLSAQNTMQCIAQ
jgi:hypothetical protein